MTPIEIARDLGVDPKTLRAWLRHRRAAGDRRLARHAPGARWEFDPGLAFDLGREFAADRLGLVMEDMRGPHAWLNWQAYSAGRPRRTTPKTSTSLVLPTWQEYALYSDAGLRSELALGPYRFLNTIAARSGRIGRASLQLVVRADDHLAEPDLTSPIEDEDVTSYFGGNLPDELAALLSLAVTRRMRSGGVVREAFADGDSAGRPTEIEHYQPVLIAPIARPMLPRIADPADLGDAQPYLERYRDISGDDAVAVVRAASQFADALWLADADARLAWIKLVGAVESAAVRWDAGKDESAVEQLRRHRKPLFNAVKGCGDEVLHRVAKNLAGTFNVTNKFKDFLLAFDPGPPAERPDVGRIDWSQLQDALGWIYAHRSRDLHAGIAFPGPLCEAPPGVDPVPHERFAPLAAEGRGGRWMAEQLPLYLHLFVHVAGGALRAWWLSLPPSARGTTDG